MKYTVLTLLTLMLVCSGFSQQVDTIYIWPDKIPGSTIPKVPAVVSDDTSRNVSRLAEVSNPFLVAFYPQSKKVNASVIICPGGGYHHLAVDIEGYEIAEWFNQMGVTAYVLLYRVPNNQAGALQDLQRTIRIARKQNPNHMIGVMGFSAGGSLSARASTLSHLKTYEYVDETDQISARPDFAVLIYPAYLDAGKNRSLTPELVISETTPPMFIFGTEEDKVGNSALVMTTAMRDNERPVELHFLAKGGHGYGMRKGNIAAETWPSLLEKWLLIILEE